jgi:hypothetical protein
LISQKLSGEKQKGTFDKYIEGLKKNYKVELSKDISMEAAPGAEKKEIPQSGTEKSNKSGEEQKKNK